jgi:ribosomal protein S15P/S13E
MTTDERLERLTERHEALTGHVEMLTADLTRMRGLMDEIMVGVARLVHVAEIHERRINRLEEGSNAA